MHYLESASATSWSLYRQHSVYSCFTDISQRIQAPCHLGVAIGQVHCFSAQVGGKNHMGCISEAAMVY